MPRDAVFPPQASELYARNQYSPAVRANGLLFVSGQVGARDDGSPEPNVEQQMHLAFQNLQAVLAAAGCTFDDVVDVTLLLVDAPATLPVLQKVLPHYWGNAPYPALTGVGVTWLSGFALEIKVVAQLPERATA